MFVSQIISALILTVLLLTVPFVWWLCTARKRKGFFGWLGWTRVRTDEPARLLLATAVVLVVYIALSVLLIPALSGRTGDVAFSGLGWAALAPMLLKTIYQTAFLEECFFRGFLLKRVGARFGITTGNIVQGLVFGLMHGVPYVLQGHTLLLGVVLTVFTGSLGYCMGWLNERLAGGSLWPSYLVHVVANLFGTVLVLVGIV
ncbi:MAG: CPBP family intramembrane metalloprotease [Propionibacterium sp.]|nr:CPBP family intramembrane metalloprotease [Propionibacterium sp.]